ncbi:MAG: selenocysteine-specific translation elongation factor [Syntrophus sp. (in: bacteria)]
MTGIDNRDPEILSVMVGTAGHVDHGKTELVRLLTGCDTDCLPEEKKRGMSIDLGFAPLILDGSGDGSRMVGIIDVPGHEDFIRNMIAGASSIDVLVLVIAADDGIMPQTIEHLKIVSLLRTPQVMAVITKIDLVTPERQQEIKENVAALLSKHGFSDAQIIPESNMTGDGIGEVREAINRLVGAVKRAEDTLPQGVPMRAFRMNIERVFSVKGYGTVVTGIPLTGKCSIRDELELFPGPKSVVCRAIQKYSFDSNDAQAHVCSAINIRGVKLPDIGRGMALALPGVYQETLSAILSVENVHVTISVKRRQEMRFCCGTSNRVVSCLLAGSRDMLGPGEKGFIQIKFSTPIVLAAGDRFILRSLSPSATVAGGVVLTTDVDARKKKMRMETERLELARMAAESNNPFLSELIAGSRAVINRSDLPRLVQNSNVQIIKIITDEAAGLGVIVPVGTSQWVIKSRIAELEEKLNKALAAYHKENALSLGMPAQQACKLLGLDNDCLEDLHKIFVESSIIRVHSDCVSLRDFSIGLTAKQKELREKIIKRTAEAGKPAIPSGTLQAELGATSSDMQLLLRVLSEEGLVTLIDRYIVHGSVVNECRDKLLELFKEESMVELGRFREITGLSRNLAVPILDYFDSQGITRRKGTGRTLMDKAKF